MPKLHPSQKLIALGLAAIFIIGISIAAFTVPGIANSTEPEIELSADELENLQFLYEEEKLARDVYSLLYSEWNLSIFANIAASEQNHINAVANLLKTYDPAGMIDLLEPGLFNNPDLQILFDGLIELGRQSEIDALLVGASIEEIDILDIQAFIANTTNGDVIAVYNNLEKGSRNHLRSFTGQLAQWGVNYSPQYLSIEEFDGIVNSA